MWWFQTLFIFVSFHPPTLQRWSKLTSNILCFNWVVAGSSCTEFSAGLPFKLIPRQLTYIFWGICLSMFFQFLFVWARRNKDQGLFTRNVPTLVIFTPFLDNFPQCILTQVPGVSTVNPSPKTSSWCAASRILRPKIFRCLKWRNPDLYSSCMFVRLISKGNPALPE